MAPHGPLMYGHQITQWLGNMLPTYHFPPISCRLILRHQQCLMSAKLSCKCLRNSPFHKTLPKSSLQMHWISLKFDEFGNITVVLFKYILFLGNFFVKFFVYPIPAPPTVLVPVNMLIALVTFHINIFCEHFTTF